MAKIVSEWKQLFRASWRDFATVIGHIKTRTERNKRLISNQASPTELEGIQNYQVNSVHDFEREKENRDSHNRSIVMEWLSPFICETEQDRHTNARSVCKDPGRWLMEKYQFQAWFSPEFCRDPLLWLSGIPGAGKISSLYEMRN